MTSKGTGIGNSGNYNSGDYNSGDYNSGRYNSGKHNSGSRNSGKYNSGYCNSGNCNSGNYNSGIRNSGNYNSGNCNSGKYNSGKYNSGNCNSGRYNSGDYNSGSRNSGFFNTEEPPVRLFNKDTNLKRCDIKLPYVNLKLTEWVQESAMTVLQKQEYPEFRTKGGTLIHRTYKEAWALYWDETSKEDKQLFLDLPNFDSEIFKEITGIDVASQNCNGKVVEIDGVKYKLTEVGD